MTLTLTTRFKTVLTDGFNVQNGPNRAASGGVTFTQLRKTASGGYLKRKMDSNGNYHSTGPTVSITEGEANRLLDLSRYYPGGDKEIK